MRSNIGSSEIVTFPDFDRLVLGDAFELVPATWIRFEFGERPFRSTFFL
jgi:hypothetical protein